MRIKVSQAICERWLFGPRDTALRSLDVLQRELTTLQSHISDIPYSDRVAQYAEWDRQSAEILRRYDLIEAITFEATDYSNHKYNDHDWLSDRTVSAC